VRVLVSYTTTHEFVKAAAWSVSTTPGNPSRLLSGISLRMPRRDANVCIEQIKHSDVNNAVREEKIKNVEKKHRGSHTWRQFAVENVGKRDIGCVEMLRGVGQSVVHSLNVKRLQVTKELRCRSQTINSVLTNSSCGGGVCKRIDRRGEGELVELNVVLNLVRRQLWLYDSMSMCVTGLTIDFLFPSLPLFLPPSHTAMLADG
jgi:hypothetical protein